MRRSCCTDGRTSSSRGSGSRRMSPPCSATWRWSTEISTTFRTALDNLRGRRATYCELHAMPLLVLQADYNIAYLYYLRGEYARALELYRAAQGEVRRPWGHLPQRALRSGSIGNLSRAESQRRGGRPRAAGARALRQDGNGVRGGEGRDERRHRDEQPGRAPPRPRALRARTRALRARAEIRSGWRSSISTRRSCCIRSGDHVRARRVCRTALRLFAHASAPGRAGLCELLLARLELEAGELALAERACARRLRDTDVGVPRRTSCIRPTSSAA